MTLSIARSRKFKFGKTFAFLGNWDCQLSAGYCLLSLPGAGAGVTKDCFLKFV